MAEERMLNDEILLGLIKANSGGGGGTTDYADLSNKPQINNVTLSGDKSASDLGLQDALTAGDYIIIENDEISVSKLKQGKLDLYSYEFVTTDASHTPKVKVIKKVNGETISETVYDEFQAASWMTFDNIIKFRYDASDSYKWKYQCLVTSNEHTKDTVISWYWNQTVDYTETFDVGSSAITDLVTKGDMTDVTGNLSNLATTAKTNLVAAVNELNTGLSGKQNVLTFDSVPTDGSANPVESNGVYDALALKQDASGNSTLTTTDKTIVGAINEVNSNLSSLEDWTDADTKTVTGNPITLTDAAAVNAKALSMSVEPIQDLHGYDKPWVGGAGYNKWDEEWEGGSFNTNTGVKDVGTSVTSKNPIPVISGENHYFKTAGKTMYIFEYDENMNYLRYTTKTDAAFVIPSNCAYIQFEMENSYGTTYNNDIAINYPSTVTTYSPYTNICPISGLTEGSVETEGKNLLDKSAVTSGYRIDISTGLPDAILGFSVTDYIKCNESTTYTANWQYFSGGNYGMAFYDANKMYISGARQASEAGHSSDPWTFTTPNSAKYIRMTFVDENVDVNTLQVELGTTPTAYTPYVAPHTATITFGQTVYGGTVDFNTGKVRVTHKSVDLSALSWTATTASRWYTSDLTDIKTVSSLDDVVRAISDRFVAYSFNQLFNDESKSGMSLHTNGNFFVRNLSTTDTPVGQICYELATPTELTLTPAQLELLKGNNTITANGATITLTYQPDNLVGEVMEQVQPQIDELAESVVDRFDDIVGYSERVNRLNYKELTWTNGTRDDSGEHVSSEGSHYSNMIEVLPNTTYTISGTISTATTWRIYYLTSNGTWISRTSTLPRPYTFTTPSNCGNIQIQCAKIDSLSGAQLQYGDVARPFETYKDQLGLLLDRVPNAPTTDGTYNLQVTVASGTPTYSWVSTT